MDFKESLICSINYTGHGMIVTFVLQGVSLTKPTLPLWKAFWVYAIPFSLLYQLLWGQVFAYLSANDWPAEGYKAVLISKHGSEVLIYAFMGYFLAKLSSSASRLSKFLSVGLFFVLLLVTVKALLMDIEVI